MGSHPSLTLSASPLPTPGPRYDTSKFEYNPTFVDELEKKSVENWKRALSPQKRSAVPPSAVGQRGRRPLISFPSRKYHTQPPTPPNQHAAEYLAGISTKHSEMQAWKGLVGRVGSAAFPPPSALEVVRAEEEEAARAVARGRVGDCTVTGW